MGGGVAVSRTKRPHAVFTAVARRSHGAANRTSCAPTRAVRAATRHPLAPALSQPILRAEPPPTPRRAGGWMAAHSRWHVVMFHPLDPRLVGEYRRDLLCEHGEREEAEENRLEEEKREHEKGPCVLRRPSRASAVVLAEDEAQHEKQESVDGEQRCEQTDGGAVRCGGCGVGWGGVRVGIWEVSVGGRVGVRGLLWQARQRASARPWKRARRDAVASGKGRAASDEGAVGGARGWVGRGGGGALRRRGAPV